MHQKIDRTSAREKRQELPPDASFARSKAELALFWMLEQYPETRGLFRLNVLMPFRFGPRRAELDLYSESLALCIEVDGPQAKDALEALIALLEDGFGEED